MCNFSQLFVTDLKCYSQMEKTVVSTCMYTLSPVEQIVLQLFSMLDFVMYMYVCILTFCLNMKSDVQFQSIVCHRSEMLLLNEKTVVSTCMYTLSPVEQIVLQLFSMLDFVMYLHILYMLQPTSSLKVTVCDRSTKMQYPCMLFSVALELSVLFTVFDNIQYLSYIFTLEIKYQILNQLVCVVCSELYNFSILT